jgi:hypothetical protein
MLTGWKKLNKEQRKHCRAGEARLRYNNDALVTFRWQAVCRADSEIKGFKGHEVCWTCKAIATALGYNYLLQVFEDWGLWSMMDNPVQVLDQYKSITNPFGR